MILNFSEVTETVMPNFKGGEKEAALKMSAGNLNRIMVCRLIPGAKIDQ